MAGSINWSQVLKRCRPEVHKKIMETRSRHEELRRMITESKTAMPTIDFTRYRELLPHSSHAFVSELEASMGKFKVNKVDTAPMLQALEAERSEKMAEATKFLEDLELDVAKLKHKLALLRNSKPVDELTPDDVYEARPELKKSFEEALSNDNWSTEDGKTDPKEQAAHH